MRGSKTLQLNSHSTSRNSLLSNVNYCFVIFRLASKLPPMTSGTRPGVIPQNGSPLGAAFPRPPPSMAVSGPSRAPWANPPGSTAPRNPDP